MLPSKFVEMAGFPMPWKESHLQEYIADKLRGRGFSVSLEVKANGGRADIVTNWQGGSIIEVKKYLDRNNIYQACGQAGLYGLNNQHKLVIIGFLTPDAREQQSAFTTASMVEQNSRIKVIFINLENEWLPSNTIAKTSSWLPKLGLPKLNLPKITSWGWWWVFTKENPLILGILTCLVITLFAR